MTTATTISMTFDNATIPSELKSVEQWICWRAVQNGDRVEKIPICPMTGELASTTDPETWSDYTTAVTVAAAHGLGIGFVFTRESGIVGVDLDHCRNPETGHLEPWADETVRHLNSYTEISPSDTGLHVLAQGQLPAGRRKKGQMEVYEHGRFFTVTGRHLSGTPRIVEARTAELAAFHARYLADPEPRPGPSHNGHPTCALSDDDILDKCRSAKNAAKFEALWRGE